MPPSADQRRLNPADPLPSCLLDFLTSCSPHPHRHDVVDRIVAAGENFRLLYHSIERGGEGLTDVGVEVPLFEADRKFFGV